MSDYTCVECLSAPATFPVVEPDGTVRPVCEACSTGASRTPCSTCSTRGSFGCPGRQEL